MSRCFVLMGVSGCGKTSVGQALAADGFVAFFDGDDLHPKENIAKMTRGEPLDDADRGPWLAKVGQTLAQHEGPIVVGCSALKKQYRDIIRAEVEEDVHFLHLDAPKSVLVDRVANRPGHFMPSSLLDSQFAALEHLMPGESGTRVDISQSFEGVMRQSKAYLRDTLG
ncbi:gluconokinase [uncultured Litoreibacter sp.]|uniref:gluconokinase n=1 Tax=uncultured Litoreibacter sp. TaxID=1392394 RepID=UPI002610E9B5|nr:gluconokinase [uncultured Litoreibacter sp.]